MSRLSAELVAAMNRQGCRAEQGGTRIVARSQSPAGSETFRSGWSRPPQLTAPRGGTSPASSDTSTRSNGSNPSCFRAPVASAMTRSDSAPCGRPNISSNKVAQWDLSDSRVSRLRQRSRAPWVTQPSDHDVVSGRLRAQSVASDRSDRSKPNDESVRSTMTEPSFMIPPVHSGSSAPDVQGPRHEGWLSKRTSHKMAARWQCRYWTLEANTLRYHKQPGGACLRSFDIRRAQSIEMVPGSARELELDFGFRAWRVRAENPQSARRWHLLLEAARLVAGEPCGEDVEEAGNWSDDDTASSCSTTDSVTSDTKADQDAQRHGRTLTTRAKGILPSTMQSLLSKAVDPPPPKVPSKVELLSAAAIADRLEVDPDALDRCFDTWLKNESADEGTPYFGSTKPAGLRNGLSDALLALWSAFGGVDPESAVSSWKGPQLPEPLAFAEASESVISEYLSRMLSRLLRWIEECDPSADEIADVAVWVVFDAKSALEQFESLASIELNSKPMTNWHKMAEEIEILLLGEWETRSCDELCQMVEATYAKSSASRVLLSDSGDEFGDRVDTVLDRVRMALQHEVWQGHSAACDRAISVLIASLNAVLRSYRGYVQTLLSLTLPNGGKLSGSGSKWKLGKVLSRLSKHAQHGSESPKAAASLRVTQTAIAMAAAEAAKLAEFCRTAQAAQSSLVTAEVPKDVLAAFCTAFEREEFQLSVILAEFFFGERYRRILKEISFSGVHGNSHEAHQESPPRLGNCCDAARTFVEEATASSASPCRAQVCDAVIRLIVQSWVRALRRGPPRLSTSTTDAICNTIEADEAALHELAANYGATAKWARQPFSQDPLQPLREIRQIFEDSSSDKVVICTARLEVMLGAELGSAVAGAIRFTMTH